MTTNITVAQAIAQGLKRHGVEFVFAQSLPSAVILACEEIGIRQIAYRQENMGGVMADGYARVSGKVSVVAAQNGPAATLLVAPLAEAFKASVPVIALVQEVERNQADRNAFQEIDHVAVFASCAKWTRKLITADRVDDYVDAAFIAAASGRPGPAVLLLPADVLREEVPASVAPRKASLGHWPLDRVRPPQDLIDTVAKKIAAAEHPVLMVGGGAVASRASAAIAKLQELAHLPVFTTNMGKGAVAETHPLSCGVLGALVGPTALGKQTLPIYRAADLIVQIGTRNNQNGTDNWRNVSPTAELVQIDLDPQEIGRNYEATRLIGDAASTVEALNDALAGCDLSKRKARRTAVEQRIAAAWAAFEDARTPMTTDRAPLRPERVMATLQHLIGPDDIVVADASYSSMWVVGQLRSKQAGSRFITPRGLAGLGWGLPLAIGAKLARPEGRVIALVGDGGFAHSWAELETLTRMNVPVLVIVLNNGILGFQRDAETVKFGSFTTACHFHDVEHAAIARACGCQGWRVSDAAELDRALAQWVQAPSAALLEVITDPEAHPPLSLFAGTLDREPEGI
ncbi:acetolactate synthase catalytic subunit [Pandoraea pulmonicola]|uniref:Acetolactate synthase catalytic subunit n=1 Tax=Pandoraea pulmonicola TaxID=93221 RepID=A0AAJ5CZI5_PANPU|nr:acetolactate synthase catalytic subunit [Pandoraea pulmonicola]AJC21565.1 acetolactate synthase catalytic subunit [Pandoraea pulmonicola]SUA89629.1 Acetolactate synthase large subunit IlvB1 [Pandoraea pulmonicola]